MKHATPLAATTIGILAGTLVYATFTGSFLREGGQLLAMPWGQATLVDLYVGIALFVGWVAHRERSTWRTAAWSLAFVLTGNLATCIYVLRAASTSLGDSRKFWHGQAAA